ncbi:MAG: AzlC family ABC transporter permease [Chloroflexota bacterium]|nr:AzlC family ABC transporter permease [Chloroflexota bacterium]
MKSEMRRAFAEGWPVLVTAMVVGMAFGIAAREGGLSALEASGMSILIFAGAAQFAAVDLIARGAPPVLVVGTVLLLNLRHLLMGASLRAHLGERPIGVRLLAAYLLTDESFALGIARYRRGVHVAYYLTFAGALWACWNVGTLLGATFVSGTIDPKRFGLDFAITATFVAIVALGIRGRIDIAVALIAAVVAGVLRLAGASTIAVVAAGAVAPLVAVAWRRRQ